MSQTLLYGYIKKRKAPLLLVMGIGFVNSMLSFLLTVSTGEFFTLQFHSNGSKSRLLSELGIHLHSMNSFFLFYFLLLLLKLPAEFLEGYFTAKEGERFAATLRNRLFACQVQQHPSVFGSKQYQYYLLRYSNDMKSVQGLLTKGILGNAKDAAFVLMGYWVLLQVHAIAAAGIIVLTAVSFTVISSLLKKQTPLVGKSREQRSGLLAFTARMFARQARLYKDNRQDKTISRFHEKSASLYQASLAQLRYESMVFSLIPLMQFASLAVLMLLVKGQSIAITSGDALVLVLVVLLLRSPLRRILKSPGIINKGNISLKKIASLMQETPPGNTAVDANIPAMKQETASVT
jgi:ABC-type multidrug transport system fused ATPase/permease subunit